MDKGQETSEFQRVPEQGREVEEVLPEQGVTGRWWADRTSSGFLASCFPQPFPSALREVASLQQGPKETCLLTLSLSNNLFHSVAGGLCDRGKWQKTVNLSLGCEDAWPPLSIWLCTYKKLPCAEQTQWEPGVRKAKRQQPWEWVWKNVLQQGQAQGVRIPADTGSNP